MQIIFLAKAKRNIQAVQVNFKERELGLMLFNKLKQQFPELELVSITESMESTDQFWVNVIMPGDEDREIAIQELASQISTDILMVYGYHITIMSAPNMMETMPQPVV